MLHSMWNYFRSVTVAVGSLVPFYALFHVAERLSPAETKQTGRATNAIITIIYFAFAPFSRFVTYFVAGYWIARGLRGIGAPWIDIDAGSTSMPLLAAIAF